jgi:hypothetical protein
MNQQSKENGRITRSTNKREAACKFREQIIFQEAMKKIEDEAIIASFLSKVLQKFSENE